MISSGSPPPQTGQPMYISLAHIGQSLPSMHSTQATHHYLRHLQVKSFPKGSCCRLLRGKSTGPLLPLLGQFSCCLLAKPVCTTSTWTTCSDHQDTGEVRRAVWCLVGIVVLWAGAEMWCASEGLYDVHCAYVRTLNMIVSTPIAFICPSVHVCAFFL